MIKPTVGRIVWYRPTEADLAFNGGTEDTRYAAIVADVHSGTMVNLHVFDPSGRGMNRTSVKLVEGEPAPGECEWMPYQKGQAAKTEELEPSIGAGKAEGSL